MTRRPFRLILLCTWSSLCVSTRVLGPVKLWGTYSWKAQVGREVAESQETSLVPPETCQRLECESDDVILDKFTSDFFTAYPKWLTRFPVTFGLFRSVSREDGSTDFCFLGIPLLTFGQHSVQKLSMDLQGRDGSPIRSSMCTVSLPIQGGLLARKARGSLDFSVTMRRTKSKIERCQISTEIVQYEPWLAGTPPIHPLRARFYLSTQSVAHAYVMWRLHRYCRTIRFDRTMDAQPVTPVARATVLRN